MCSGVQMSLYTCTPNRMTYKGRDKRQLLEEALNTGFAVESVPFSIDVVMCFLNNQSKVIIVALGLGVAISSITSCPKSVEALFFYCALWTWA
jgi:hypothetical protein